jgi:hypothetical protein
MKTRLPARRSKYRAIKTRVDGIVFASRKEADRYRKLKILAKAGHITELKLQPSWAIVIGGIKVCKYVGDFWYKKADGVAVVEDVKGFKTPVYRLKRKLMKAMFGIFIKEV